LRGHHPPCSGLGYQLYDKDVDLREENNGDARVGTVIHIRQIHDSPLPVEDQKTQNLLTDLGGASNPGWKFNEWELKGVPVRIEIGPRDISRQQVTIVRRDTSEKSTVPDTDVVNETKKLLETIQSSLFEKANRALKQAIHDAPTYDDLKRIIEAEGGFARACWCSTTADA
jgi:prolyl-tRNA synthetase